MYKLIVFDLDNTLCKSGEGLSDVTTEYLKELSLKGYKLAIASGKPVCYLTGFARALGLRDMILLGENGLVITFGVHLPPVRYQYPLDKGVLHTLRDIKDKIEEKIDGIYFQPNEIMVTPFPKNKEEADIIEDILCSFYLSGITVYRHMDCYDILPSGIDKGKAIEYLCDKLGISICDTISLGDSVNDISMLDATGYSIGIGSKVNEHTDIQFECIEDALRYLLDISTYGEDIMKDYGNLKKILEEASGIFHSIGKDMDAVEEELKIIGIEYNPRDMGYSPNDELDAWDIIELEHEESGMLNDDDYDLLNTLIEDYSWYSDKNVFIMVEDEIKKNPSYILNMRNDREFVTKAIKRFTEIYHIKSFGK